MNITPTAFGHIVFWKASQAERSNLYKELQNAAITDILPQPRPLLTVLQEELARRFPKALIRPCRVRNIPGLQITREVPQEVGNAYQLDTIFHKSPDDPDTLTTTTPIDPSLFQDICACVTHERFNVITSDQITALLSSEATKRGIRLKPSGAVYWLPHNADTALFTAIENASDTVIYAVPTNENTPDLMNASIASIHTEVHQLQTRLDAAINDPNTGPLYLERRKPEIEALIDKIRAYESLFQLQLPNLHTMLNHLNTSALNLSIAKRAAQQRSQLPPPPQPQTTPAPNPLNQAPATPTTTPDALPKFPWEDL